MSTRLIFCDESGHTGADLLDPEQPLLAVSMLSLPTSALDGLESRVSELKAKNGVFKDAKLKFKNLKKSAPGCAFLADIGSMLVELDCVFYMSLVEKRYHAGVLFVETFLDPEHNPTSPPETHGELRKEIVERFLAVVRPDELRSFVDAIRNDSRAAAAEIGRAIATRFKLDLRESISHLGRVIEGGLHDFFWLPLAFDDMPRNLNKANPLVTAFAPSLALINADLVTQDANAQIVGDEDAQFGEAIFKMVTSTRAAEQLAEFNYDVPLTAFTDYRRAADEEHVGVSLADLAAGLLVDVVRFRIQQVDPPSRIQKAWEAFHPSLLKAFGRCFVTATKANLEKGLLRLK